MLETTINQYVMPTMALLAMLIREGQSSNDEMMRASQALKNKLENRSDKAIICKHIHDILMIAWTTLWKHISSVEINDPTKRCLAFLTVQRDGSFKEPKYMTNIIARFEYCMQLAFFREIRAKATISTSHDEGKACDALQSWFTEKTYSPFAHLHSLQHYASAISYDTMNLPNIWWTENMHWKSLLYKGEEIHFNSICNMFMDMEAKVVKTWEDKILKGLDL